MEKAKVLTPEERERIKEIKELKAGAVCRICGVFFSDEAPGYQRICIQCAYNKN